MYSVNQPTSNLKKMVPFSFLLLCLLTVGAWAQDNGVAEFNKGETIFEQHNYSGALTLFKKAASKGNADAMDAIGTFYFNGFVFRGDYAKAMLWFQKAAAKGNAIAMYNVGHLYLNGLGVKKDGIQAKNWFQKSAAKGFVPAMNKIGDLYKYGVGVKQDDIQAKQWYQKAANQDLLNNQKAANKGDLNAMLALAVFYSKQSWQVKGADDEAIKWITKAADKLLSSDKSDVNTMINLADIADNNGLAVWTATKLYKKAAAKGNAIAMYHLGEDDYYGHGFRVNPDYDGAMKWYKKSAAKGNAAAMRGIGDLYFYGKGVVRNRDVAAMWYQNAAAKGG